MGARNGKGDGLQLCTAPIYDALEAAAQLHAAGNKFILHTEIAPAWLWHIFSSVL